MWFIEFDGIVALDNHYERVLCFIMTSCVCVPENRREHVDVADAPQSRVKLHTWHAEVMTDDKETSSLKSLQKQST